MAGGGGGAQEELRAVGAGAGVGHGEGARAGVLEREVLVGELGAVDRLAARACVCREANAQALSRRAHGQLQLRRALLRAAPDRALLLRAQSSPGRGGDLPRRLGCWAVGRARGPFVSQEQGVPLPRVKSPPWHMNCEMTRWKAEPLKCSGLPLPPMPFSPVHRARKFCAQRGRALSLRLQSGSGAEREQQSADGGGCSGRGRGGEGCRVHYHAGVVGMRADPGGARPRSWARRQHAASSRCGRPGRRRWSCQSRRRDCPWLLESAAAHGRQGVGLQAARQGISAWIFGMDRAAP